VCDGAASCEPDCYDDTLNNDDSFDIPIVAFGYRFAMLLENNTAVLLKITVSAGQLTVFSCQIR
jgi:hypothetical protein